MYVIEECGSTISATRPVPVADDAYPYPYPTRAENFYQTRPKVYTVSRKQRIPLNRQWQFQQ